MKLLRTCVALATLLLCVPKDAAAYDRKLTHGINVASHQLGFSNAFVSVREDYTHTKWPVARRTFSLRGPNGKSVSLPIHDGGPGRLTALSLYKRADPQLDSHGHAIGGDYILVGVRDCVGFDPVFLDVKACAARPPCNANHQREGLIYLGRFDWANGFDPPRGEFGFRWRFLPFENGIEENFCPEGKSGN
jgi:hypothetical protein